jgi:hypothetical protein
MKKSSFITFLLSCLITSTAVADNVCLTFQTKVAGSYLTNENNELPNPDGVFDIEKPVTIKLTYDPTSSATTIIDGIAQYNLSGIFQVIIEGKIWSASSCELTIGNYEAALTPADMLNIDATLTPPAGFDAAPQKLRLSMSGKLPPISFTTGCGLPNITNVPLLPNVEGASMGLEPIIPANTTLPWWVNFGPIVSITVTAVTP